MSYEQELLPAERKRIQAEQDARRRRRCPGHARHWFAVRGHVGLRSPKCVRCGAPNPRTLTTDDWWEILAVAPHLIDDPEALRQSLLEDERAGVSGAD